MNYLAESPYGAYWSTPFTRWQGSFANLHSVEFAAHVAKRELARRICDRFHGEGAGTRAEERFDKVHRHREVPDDVPSLELDAGAGDVHLPALISRQFGVSSSEARRLLTQGAVKLDGEPVDGERLDVGADELRGRVLQVGRRRFVRIS